jgi:Arc/MetJ-type ribon-helix-helix transcriptional regulator
MTTVSIALTKELNEFLSIAVLRGDADNKSAVVRRALESYRSDQAFERVLQAQAEARAGKTVRLSGSLNSFLEDSDL